jgi:NADH-quinone oxidoreductase subunit L
MGGVIDMRRFGGLRKLMPITCFTFLFGSLALAGVIPFAGFWSKDAILVAVLERGHQSQAFQWLYYGGIVTALLTAMYTFRAFFLTFYGEEEIPAGAGHHAHESPGSMTGPLCMLAICALVVGFFQTGFGTMLGSTPSLSYQAIPSPAADHHAHFQVAALSTVIALLGVALAAFLYLGDQREVRWITALIKPVYLLSYGKFFFDPIYKVLIVWPALALAQLAYWIDRYVVDGLVNLAGKLPLWLGAVLRTMQTGLLQYYAMLMVLGLLVLIGTLFL